MSMSRHSARNAQEARRATYFVYRTPLGRVTLGCDGYGLTRAAFGVAKFEGEYRSCALTNRASSEILEYLAKKRERFTLPLHPAGSAFQKKVWEYVCSIPYGQTRTYAQVASDLGIPKGLHAISSACNQNPLPFFIPSHRVIGIHGDMGGFVTNPAVKQFLVDLESGHENPSRKSHEK